jgi:hypothetical protein
VIQDSYAERPEVAKAGMPADTGVVDDLSGMASSRKLVSVAIVAANDAVYTITINGTPFEYTADGSATTAEITVGLRNLINAGSEPVTASGTDTPLLIESDLFGEDGDFTYADSATGGSLTETVLVAHGQEIPVGVHVCLDDNSSQNGPDLPIRLPRQATDITGGDALGCVLYDQSREAFLDANDNPAYRAYTMIPVRAMGRVWVKVEEAVTKGGAVYVRYAAGGNGPGSYGAAAGSSERALLPNAKYLSSASADGLALLKLNG